MRSLRTVSANVFLSVAALCLFSFGETIEAQQAVQMKHDPTRPFKVWVYCIDSSLSPRADEFQRLQSVLEEAADKDVSYNDLVWLIEIGPGLAPTKPFEMPPLSSSMRRESRKISEAQLQRVKSELTDAIQHITQTSGTTNVGASLDAARAILASQVHATRRTLVVGTDFINDSGHGRASLDPPPTVLKNYVRGVNVDLLVAYPTPKYLQAVGITPAELLEHVTTAWAPYFRNDGALTVAVSWVDAVPVPAERR